jgi:hypothetical protein
MRSPVVVFRRIESISSPFTLEWMKELSGRSPIVFASDIDGISLSSFFENHGFQDATYLPIETDIPIEVQDVFPRLPSDILYILLDLEASPSIISYRTPCVWFPFEDQGISVLQAVEVIRRASWVLGTEELRERFDIDSQYFRNVSLTSIKEIADLCLEAKIRQPDDVLHGLLVAEILHRDHLLEEAFNNIKVDLPHYLHKELKSRIFPSKSDSSPGLFASDEKDLKGEIISSYLHSNDQVVENDSSYKPVGLLEHISGISSSGSLRELLQLYEKAVLHNATEVSLKLIYQAIANEFSSKHVEVLFDFPDFFNLLPSAEFVSSLSLQDAMKMIQIPEVPDTALEGFETEGSYFVSLAGRLALHLRKSQEDISESVIDDFATELKKIDGNVVYEGLWLTGLRFWRDVNEGESNPYSESFVEPEFIQIDKKYKPSEVAALDRKARRYLSVGLYDLSCRTFELVRSAAKSNRQFSTELAARLNIGWARWAQGKSRESWEPYIASTLNEVGPSKDLASLRFQLDDFLRANRKSQQDNGRAFPSRKQKIRKRSKNLLVFVRKSPVLAVPFLGSIIFLRKGLRLLKRIAKKILLLSTFLLKKVFVRVRRRGKA